MTPLGTPVTVTTTADEVSPAKADTLGTTLVIGVCIRKANAAQERGGVRYAGPVTLTEDQWALVLTGESSLTARATYYVSQATAGKLTKTKPGSGLVTTVGYALSATTLFVKLGVPLASTS